MEIAIVVSGLLLATGLAVCLGLFLETQREVARLRRSIETTHEPRGAAGGMAIRIPVDPLPPVTRDRKREGLATASARAHLPVPEEELSEDETRLRAKLSALRKAR